jgi:hypothetical protein
MKTPTTNHEIVFGSNTILNCDGIISFKDKGKNQELITFKEDKEGKILVNCTLKDIYGETVVELRNGEVVKIKERYLKQAADSDIRIINEFTGDIWLEVSSLGPRKLKINGIFFFPGFKIVATDDYLKINNSITFSSNIFENCSDIMGLQ